MTSLKPEQKAEKRTIMSTDMSAVNGFLKCKTPQAWVEHAMKNMDLLLLDHAQCEKKAASMAMTLMFRYSEWLELQKKLAQLAREELLHFEQVIKLIDERGIAFKPVPASRYAKSLHQHVASHEPHRLIDTMLVGAIIEARSCERFSLLALSITDEGLAKYYKYLLHSESRHFEDYLRLAKDYAVSNLGGLNGEQYVEEKLGMLLEQERELIESVDQCFQFHSGPPA